MDSGLQVVELVKVRAVYSPQFDSNEPTDETVQYGDGTGGA
jgi:hypothetical protein